MREEKVGNSSLPTDITLHLPGGGEGDREEHWWPSQPGKPGEQLPAGCGEPLLVHHGNDGDAQVLRRLEEQEWLQSQA